MHSLSDATRGRSRSPRNYTLLGILDLTLERITSQSAYHEQVKIQGRSTDHFTLAATRRGARLRDNKTQEKASNYNSNESKMPKSLRGSADMKPRRAGFPEGSARDHASPIGTRDRSRRPKVRRPVEGALRERKTGVAVARAENDKKVLASVLKQPVDYKPEESLGIQSP